MRAIAGRSQSEATTLHHLTTRLQISLATLAFTLVFAHAVWASITGSISGIVKDPSGAVIPAASVVALNTRTGVRQTAVTDSDGFYSFPELPIGDYTISIESSGFRPYKQTGLVIDISTALRVDITLQVGAVSQEVTVSSTAVHVETTSTQQGEVITGTHMTSLPLNGRSYTDLLALQPGVAPQASGEYITYTNSSTSVSGGLDAGGLSINGQRETANGFTVNGADVNESIYQQTSVVPNLDSIAEFRILTSNFDAEYGNYSGGQIMVVTKSGSNQFHGDVFEFLRNDALDSRNFFSPTRGSFKQNQFGGTVGGPYPA
jgi:Carboxypeptidase regulatory-like domain/TonB-dependent Receptor Plug Domain